jgi:hypothetical protein
MQPPRSRAARGGERLVEDAAGLGKRERHRVSP